MKLHITAKGTLAVRWVVAVEQAIIAGLEAIERMCLHMEELLRRSLDRFKTKTVSCAHGCACSLYCQVKGLAAILTALCLALQDNAVIQEFDQ